MRILSNRSYSISILCLVLAVFSLTGGDVALSQGKKGTAVSLSGRESVAHHIKAAIAQQERASADDANQEPDQNAPQWRQTSGPRGGVITAIFRHGSTLFAGTRGGGAFRSTDQGATWIAVNTGLPASRIVYSFAAVGTELYAGTFGGIYRSSDNGMSWRLSYAGLGVETPLVYSLAVAGTDIFAWDLRRGVIRATNQETGWGSVNTGLPPPPFQSTGFLAVVGTNVFLGSSARVFRTTDRGESWTEGAAGLPSKSVRALIASGTTLLVGTTAGVYRSTNLGESWTETNTGLTDSSVYSLTTVGTSLFAGTEFSGVFRSTDQGDNWTRVSTGLTDPFVTALAADGTNILAGTFGGGVFRSSNQGDDWTVSNTGLISTSVTALATMGKSLFAATEFSGVYRSSNQGDDWTAINNGLTDRQVTALTAVGSSLFAGTFDGGVFSSNDQGENWTAANTGLPPNARVSSFAAIGTSLFVGLAGNEASIGVYRSTNQGANWTSVTSNLPNSWINALAVVGTNLFALTAESVFRTTNQGASWTKTDSGFPPFARVYLLAASGPTLFAMISGVGVYRSTNQGESWTKISDVFPSGSVNSLVASGRNVFAAINGSSVFYSTDNGENWTSINSGLTIPRVLSLAVSGRSLLAGTSGGGVFITDPFPSLNANVSAASFSGTELAPESIAAAFGARLATATAPAPMQPLPTTIAGTSVKVQDSGGQERPAPLFFVSPGQLNFQIPRETATGGANVIVTSGDGATSSATVQIAMAAPGIFSANSDGQGVAAAVALRIKADGTSTYEPIARFDNSQNKFVAVPIDLGPDMGSASDQLFLILFGTGVRFRSDLSAVTATIGRATGSGVDAPVQYAGAQGDFVGLDQINLPLSRSLAGRGEVSISLIVDGKRANLVSVSIR